MAEVMAVQRKYLRTRLTVQPEDFCDFINTFRQAIRRIDVTKFFRKHRRDVVQLLQELARYEIG